MVTATQNGKRKMNTNGRTSRSEAAVGQHQGKRRGVQRKQVTAWIKPDDRKLLQLVADSRDRTVSAVAGELLSESLRDAQAQPDAHNIRFTESEGDTIRKRAFELGMTPEEFIRKMIFSPGKQAVNGTLNGRKQPIEVPTHGGLKDDEPLSEEYRKHLKTELTNAQKRPPSQPVGPTENRAVLLDRPTVHKHPVGDLYRRVCRMNERAAKLLKSLRRIQRRHEDELHYYLESNYDSVGHVEAMAIVDLLTSAFDCYMHTMQSVWSESDDAYARVKTTIENADDHHTGFLSRCRLVKPE